MKKTLLFFITLFVSFANHTYSQWQKIDLNKMGGGAISNAVNQLTLDNGKLYAATADGIFESASAKGSDWAPFGLQGKRVFLLSFGVLKLALVAETATDDATKKTLQLYKFNGTDWVNTNFNPTKLNIFGTALDNLINFAQIQNGNQTVIVIPTWGNGIWRSTDNGDTWTISAYAPCDATPNALFYKKIPGIYSYNGDPVLYGTDKPSGDNFASNMQYVIYSDDFGATWNNIPVANFFNPWTFHKRKVGGKSYFYWGGKDGNQGVIWRSADAGANWDASLSLGVEFWDNRRIIGDDDGPLYAMCSANNVYVSTDNGDSFAPVGTGITFPATMPKPAGEPFFLTNLVKSTDFLYLSTYNDGIYSFDLKSTGITTVFQDKLNFKIGKDQKELIVSVKEGSQISVYSITGKLEKSIAASAFTTNVNVKNLPASVYLLQVVTPNGKTIVARFVKK
ncbi:MAG: T9SS type A sorting domain-containing protein [Bacteroidales bacterium]